MVGVLKPGITAPDFILSAINLTAQVSLEELAGKLIVLLFIPSNFVTDSNNTILQFEEKRADFDEHNTVVLGITDADENDLKLFTANTMTFPLLFDQCHVVSISSKYGTISKEGMIQPTVFLIDEQKTIRKVYESSKYPNLPNPAMIIRAIIKLENTPTPAPVTDDDWQFGPSDAPITIIEYSDYQCKRCAAGFAILEYILPLYEGKIRLIHRHLPLRHSHPQSQIAAEAAEAAGAQGKFWEMHRRLFESNGFLERENLIEYARELSLDINRFIHDLNSGTYRDSVNQDFKRAIKNKIKLPPVLFINRILFEGQRTKDAICARIDELLSCADDF